MNTKKVMKKFMTFVFTAFLSLTIVVSLVLYSLYYHQFKFYVNSLNSSAANHYKVITSLTDYKNSLDISDNCNCVIYGESYDYLSYTAYAGDYLKEDISFYSGNGGNYQNKLYWAIKISDGDIDRVWSCTMPLEENDIHEYSVEEQRKTYRFLKKFSKIKVVGYYDTKEQG